MWSGSLLPSTPTCMATPCHRCYLPAPFLSDTAVLSLYLALHFPVSATDLEKDFFASKCSAFAALVSSVGDSKFILARSWTVNRHDN